MQSPSLNNASEQAEQIQALAEHMLADLRQNCLTPQRLDDYRKAFSILAGSRRSSTPARTFTEHKQKSSEEEQRWKEALPTGHALFDKALGGGFLPGHLYAILGAPGVGKTSLATQWATSIADAGHAVIYVTSEDSQHQIFCRAIASRSEMEYGRILRGAVNPEDLMRAKDQVCQGKSGDNFLMVEQSTAFDLDELESIVTEHAMKSSSTGAPLVIVDYLQRLARSNFSAYGTDIRQAVTLLTESLRSFAKQKHVAMVVLASQNRASYSSYATGNTLASAKESGDIEYAADVLATLIVDKKRASRDFDATPMLLKIEKNRQGPAQSIALNYLKYYQRFDEARS